MARAYIEVDIGDREQYGLELAACTRASDFLKAVGTQARALHQQLLCAFHRASIPAVARCFPTTGDAGQD